MSSRDHVDHARLLLGKAAEDATALEALAGESRVADSVVGFHAQQAAEKMLKAVLSSREIKYPWTHDIRFLVELIAGQGLTIPSDLAGVAGLSPWAAEFRYGEVLTDTLDREQALRLVNALREWATRTVEEAAG